MCINRTNFECPAHESGSCLELHCERVSAELSSTNHPDIVLVFNELDVLGYSLWANSFAEFHQTNSCLPSRSLCCSVGKLKSVAANYSAAFAVLCRLHWHTFKGC